MSYTMQDFQRDYAKKYFPQLTVEEKKELFRELPAQELEILIQVFPLEVRLAGLTPEERLAGLTPEEIMAVL